MANQPKHPGIPLCQGYKSNVCGEPTKWSFLLISRNTTKNLAQALHLGWCSSFLAQNAFSLTAESICSGLDLPSVKYNVLEAEYVGHFNFTRPQVITNWSTRVSAISSNMLYGITHLWPVGPFSCSNDSILWYVWSLTCKVYVFQEADNSSDAFLD